MLVMALSSALEPLSHLRERGWGEVRGLAAKAAALRAAPHPALRATFSREREKGYREGAPALQHAALDLVALDALEQGLEVAFAEAFVARSEEHTSELQSLMRISYAVFCLTKKNIYKNQLSNVHHIALTLNIS